MADFYLFTPSRSNIDPTDSPSVQYGLRLMVPLVGLALTGCAWPMSGDSSKPELNAQAWTDQKYEYAKGMLAQGHYGLALESFRDVLRHDSYSVKALNGVAAAYDKLGRYDLAQRYYKKALVVEPTSFRTLNNIGYSYMLAGKYKEAREFLGKAAEIDAENATLTANLKQLAEKEVAALSEKNAVGASRAEDAAWADATREAENERRMWVERSSASVQVLITQPDSNLAEWAQENGVEPRWVHVDRPEDAPTANRITVLTERYPSVNSGVGSTKIAAAPQSTDRPEGPAVTAAVSPMASPPESSASPSSGTGNEAPRAAGAAAPGLAAEQSSAGTAAEPVSNPATAAVAEGDGKPLDLTPPATTSGSSAPVQSAGVPTATDASEPRTEVTTNWIESPWKDSAAGNATSNAVTEPGPEAPGAMPQMDGGQEAASESGQQVTPLPRTDAVAATTDSQSTSLAKGSDQLAVLPPPGPGAAAPGTGQDVATPPATNAVAATPDSQSASQPKGNGQTAALPPPEPGVAAPGTGQEVSMPRQLEISNGAGRLAMAARMREHLKGLNIPVVKLTNAMSFTNKKSVLYFKPGHEGAALKLSLALPLRPELRRNPALVPDLRLVLGGDMLDFDRQLIARNFVADASK